jgi:hypothetical protein
VAEARGRLSTTSGGGASSRGAPAVGARGERNHFFGSSPFTSNKPKMAPGLQDLGVLVAPSAVLVVGDADPHGICLDPVGSGAGGYLWSASSRSTAREPAHGDDALGSTPSPAFLPVTF